MKLIKNQSHLYQGIFKHCSYAIISTDLSGLITSFNPAAEKMLGYDEKSLLGKKTPEIWHDPQEIIARAREFSKEFHEHIPPGFEVFIANAQRGLESQDEWTYIHKDGSRFPVMLGISAIYDDKNEIQGYLGIAADISKQYQVQEDLKLARDQLSKAAEVAKLGIWSWNPSNNDLEWNDQMYAMYELPRSPPENGLKYEQWLSRVHPDDVKKTETSLNNIVAGQGVYNPIFRILLPDGRLRFIQAGAIVEHNKNTKTTHVIGFNLDITAQYEHEASLEQVALLDELTGIPNHRCLEERLKIEFKRSKRTKQPLALLMIDVDFFKQYNDQYGHQAGDNCLRKIAQVLKGSLRRPADLAARYGGEEFVCLLPHTDNKGAHLIAKRLLTAVQELHIDHVSSKAYPTITISIGVAIYPSNNIRTQAALIKAADIQMYAAKKMGRNRIDGPISD